MSSVPTKGVSCFNHPPIRSMSPLICRSEFPKCISESLIVIFRFEYTKFIEGTYIASGSRSGTRSSPFFMRMEKRGFHLSSHSFPFSLYREPMVRWKVSMRVCSCSPICAAVRWELSRMKACLPADNSISTSGFPMFARTSSICASSVSVCRVM